MTRASLLLLMICAGCSFGTSNDVIVYRPVIETSAAGIRTRSLLITAAREVIGIERRPDGSAAIRIGTADRGQYRDLTTRLALASPLRGDTVPKGAEADTFEISARLGGKSIRIRRDVARHIEPDITAAVDVLSEIWDATPEATDPVGELAPFLSRPPRVRGHAATALLKIWASKATSPKMKSAAEAVLRDHLEVEEDRKIEFGIRDVIDQAEVGTGK